MEKGKETDVGMNREGNDGRKDLKVGGSAVISTSMKERIDIIRVRKKKS